MCTVLGTLNHITIFSPTPFYLIQWCCLQAVQSHCSPFSPTALHSVSLLSIQSHCSPFSKHQKVYFIQAPSERRPHALNIRPVTRTYIKTRRSTWLCFKRERLWVWNYVRRPAINVRPYFPHLMSDLVNLGTRNLYKNLFKIAHEMFKPAHELV
jgi:hypothetical protein